MSERRHQSSDKNRPLCKMVVFIVHQLYKYTETIKLCPLDVYVCQFLMYERISNNFFTLQTVII